MFTRNKFHPKTGLIPYIELNGEQFSDSNLIIEMLRKKFEVEMDTELSAEEEAMTRAATGMVESFTAQTGFYYRYGLHMEVGDKYYSSSSCQLFQDFVKTLRIGEYYGSEKTVRMWARVQPYLTRLRSYVSGVSRYLRDPLLFHQITICYVGEQTGGAGHLGDGQQGPGRPLPLARG